MPDPRPPRSNFDAVAGTDSATSSLADVVRWMGGLAFAAALGFVGWQFQVTWARAAVPGTGRVVSAALVDALLFTGFALHHSLFARLGVRGLVRQAVGSALERTVYVLIASLLFVLVGAAWRPVAGVLWDVTGPGRGVLWGVQLVGVWLTLRSAAILDIRDLAGLPAGRTRRGGFTTSGPYGWVRHPIYLGWLLLVWPVGTMTGTRAAFALLSCLYLIAAIPFEERTLLATDASYAGYLRRVRWRLIPFLY